MERHWHLWEAIGRFIRRQCAVTSDAGIPVLLILFTVFFLSGATVAVVFAVRPAATTAATKDDEPQPAARRALAGIVAAKPRSNASSDVEFDAVGLVLSRVSEVLREHLDIGRGAGLVVNTVAAESFAARAGFRRNDVLVSLDDQLLVTPDQFPALIEAADGNAPCRCRLLRGGKPLTISLALRQAAAVPPEGTAAPAAPRRPVATGRPAVADAAPKSPLRPAAKPAATAVARPKPAAAAARKPVGSSSKLRVAASVVPPSTTAKAAVVPREPEVAKPPKAGLLMRVADDTLLQQDGDYQIRVTGGSEKQLVVRDSRGLIIFNGAIETPEQRSLVPLAVRDRVERMERLLAPPSDAPGDDSKVAADEAVARGPDRSGIEWRTAAKSVPAEVTEAAATADPAADADADKVIEIGRLEIEPVEIR